MSPPVHVDGVQPPTAGAWQLPPAAAVGKSGCAFRLPRIAATSMDAMCRVAAPTASSPVVTGVEWVMHVAERRYVNLREAAGLIGRHVDTVRRAHRAGLFPGAIQDGHGQSAAWLVPVDELLRAFPLAPAGPDVDDGVERWADNDDEFDVRRSVDDPSVVAVLVEHTGRLLDTIGRLADALAAATKENGR
jgi:hypothetical protein